MSLRQCNNCTRLFDWDNGEGYTREFCSEGCEGRNKVYALEARIREIEGAICVYQRIENGHIEWEDDKTAVSEFLIRWNDETCDNPTQIRMNKDCGSCLYENTDKDHEPCSKCFDFFCEMTFPWPTEWDAIDGGR